MEHDVKEAFMRMHKRIEELEHKPIPELYPQSSEDTVELVKALVKARKEFINISKSGKGNFGRYATLEDMQEATVDALDKYNIHVSQEPFTNQYGITFVYTFIRHGDSNQWISSRCIAVQEKENDCKSLGGGITYTKKYMWRSMLGLIASEQDADGEETTQTTNNKNESYNNGVLTGESCSACLKGDIIEKPSQFGKGTWKTCSTYPACKGPNGKK